MSTHVQNQVEPGLGFDVATLGAVSLQARQEAADQGIVRTGNTHYANIQRDHLAKEIAGHNEVESVTGGVDWLSVGFCAECLCWGQLRQRLEDGRNKAKENCEPQLIQFKDIPVVIMPGGRGSGYNARRWVINADGFELSFSDRGGDVLDGQGNPLSNVYLEITGSALLEHGFRGMLARVDALFKAWGICVTNSIVSRVDLCADVVGLQVAELFKAYQKGQCITRANDYQLHGRNGLKGLQTFGLGGKAAPLKVRFYDKIAEVASDPAKVELMRVRRWGGSIPDSCTRIEFQLRRERLRDLGISTLPDLLRTFPSTVGYLTYQWLRFAPGVVDRKHTTREELSQMWVKVRATFAEWLQSWIDGEGTKPIKRGINVDRAMRCARGYLVRAFAQMDELPRCADDAVDILRSMIADTFDDFCERALIKSRDRVDLRYQALRIIDTQAKPPVAEFLAIEPDGRVAFTV